MMRRNIFLPNVQSPYVLNYSSTGNTQTHGTESIRKTYTYVYGKNYTLQNIHILETYLFHIHFLKMYTTNVHNMI